MAKVVIGSKMLAKILKRAGLAIACSLVVFINAAQASNCAEMFPAAPGEELRLKLGPLYIKALPEGIRAMIKDELDNQNTAASDIAPKTIAYISAVETGPENESSNRPIADIFETDNKVVVVLNYGRSKNDRYYAMYKDNRLTCAELPENAKELFLGQFKTAGYRINEATLKVESADSIAKSLGLDG